MDETMTSSSSPLDGFRRSKPRLYFRRMPYRRSGWCSGRTASRMRFLANTNGASATSVKNLIRDAVRPLRQPDLLYAILRNSDSASTSENREDIIEDVIVSSMQKQYLLGTSKILLREHSALKQLQKQDALEEKSDRPDQEKHCPT